MEAQGSRWRQLPVLLLWVNGLMTLGFAGAHQQTELCNESLMLEKLPTCGKSFEEMMKKVDSKKWCNLTEFIMETDWFLTITVKIRHCFHQPKRSLIKAKKIPYYLAVGIHKTESQTDLISIAGLIMKMPWQEQTEL
ncbi:receptor activity-modifying protein 3 isoform X2 [Prinia subflava]|uniref:receptor activity-modifying protein 3 isoform X2 n=1 Tax=Prinia subflava TaxID=208062 RepID=UPI002FE29368